MIRLELAKFHSALIWLDEIPSGILYSSEKQYTSSMPDCSAAGGNVRRVAVEYRVLSSGIIPYGLLAAEFIPGATGTLRVEVPYIEELGKPYHSSLLRHTFTMFIGLEIHLAKAALNGMMPALASMHGAFPCGIIRIVGAVTDDVNSSPRLFTRLGSSVIGLLAALPSNPSREDLCALLPGPFSYTFPRPKTVGEFYVSEVETIDGSLIVTGRNMGQTSIYAGDMFNKTCRYVSATATNGGSSATSRDLCDPWSVYLAVAEISLDGTVVGELGPGQFARLTLSGEGMVFVKSGSVLLVEPGDMRRDAARS